MATRDESMAGKVCLVTGATSGIGEVAATALAAKGATVVLVGRNPEKAAATAERIKKVTGNPSVEFLIADLSQQSEVRRLAEEFKAKHDRLHVLVNNAGAMFADRRESPDGIELTFALNHLGYFLLTNLLLDTLKASAPSRVVSVASYAHRMVPALDFDDLQFREKYSGFKVYGASKLANVLFTKELARRLEGTGVTANSLHPGFVATSFVEGERRPRLVVPADGQPLRHLAREKGRKRRSTWPAPPRSRASPGSISPSASPRPPRPPAAMRRRLGGCGRRARPLTGVSAAERGIGLESKKNQPRMTPMGRR